VIDQPKGIQQKIQNRAEAHGKGKKMFHYCCIPLGIQYPEAKKLHAKFYLIELLDVQKSQ
jgi:hypothetical protein